MPSSMHKMVFSVIFIHGWERKPELFTYTWMMPQLESRNGGRSAKQKRQSKLFPIWLSPTIDCTPLWLCSAAQVPAGANYSKCRRNNSFGLIVFQRGVTANANALLSVVNLNSDAWQKIAWSAFKICNEAEKSRAQLISVFLLYWIVWNLLLFTKLIHASWEFHF